jgi:hypothetical protein
VCVCVCAVRVYRFLLCQLTNTRLHAHSATRGQPWPRSFWRVVLAATTRQPQWVRLHQACDRYVWGVEEEIYDGTTTHPLLIDIQCVCGSRSCMWYSAQWECTTLPRLHSTRATPACRARLPSTSPSLVRALAYQSRLSLLPSPAVQPSLRRRAQSGLTPPSIAAAPTH